MIKHHSISDSSSEAEYKELSKCAKVLTFIHMLLGELHLVDLPGAIGEGNRGAIFLAHNKQVSWRTKLIDLMHQLVLSFIEKRDAIQHCQV